MQNIQQSQDKKMDSEPIQVFDLRFKKCYDREMIAKRVKEVAQEVNNHYSQLIKEVSPTPAITMVGTLKGAFMFFSDLAKQIKFDVQMEFIRPSSYVGTQSTGVVKFHDFIANEDIQGKHILIVQDIIDTGKTLTQVVRKIKEGKPASLQICALFRRPNRQYQVDVKFWGFQNDKFILGYGLDYNQMGRNLPQVYQKI